MANAAVQVVFAPFTTGCVQSVVLVSVSVNVMVPFGCVPEMAPNDAVNVTDWLTAEGLVADERLIVIAPAPIPTGSAEEALVAKFVSVGWKVAVTSNVPALGKMSVHVGATPPDRVTPEVHVPVGVAPVTAKLTVP